MKTKNQKIANQNTTKQQYIEINKSKKKIHNRKKKKKKTKKKKK